MLEPSQICSFKQKEGFQGRELMVQVQGTFSAGAFTVRKGSRVPFPCREESQRQHVQDQPIPPDAVSPCPQVTCAGDHLQTGCRAPRLVWAEGCSPGQGGPGLSSHGRAKCFLWVCDACSSRRPAEEVGPLATCLVPAFPLSRFSLAVGQQGNSFISSPKAWR